jgi:hypothetical protein
VWIRETALKENKNQTVGVLRKEKEYKFEFERPKRR